MSRPRPIYPSIAHLPGSCVGVGDTVAPRVAWRPGDRLWVQEKLDGTNVGIVRHGQKFAAVIRAGYPAQTARRAMHRLFACWAEHHAKVWLSQLEPGETLVGEWLLLAHGTRYVLPHEPFVVLDVFRQGQRLPLTELHRRFAGSLTLPALLATDWIEPAELLSQVGSGRHGAIGAPEGFIYRHERSGRVLALHKWVRPEYQTARYFQGQDAALPQTLRAQDERLLWECAASLGIRHFAQVLPTVRR